MSSIQQFITNKIQHRLAKSRAMVLYDPERRFHRLCLDLASEEVEIVDASGGSIESRLSALRNLGTLTTPQIKKSLLVYVAANKPVNDEQKQRDPFSVYVECGAVFPQDDADEFMNICLQAKPDHDAAIRRVFADNPSPSFETIDAIGAGIDWPQLRAALKVDSATDILIALLAPTPEQSDVFKRHEHWSQEAKAFLKMTLGMEVKTRSKNFNPLSQEVWRFLLFSEFYFDLPVPLPSALELVPRASREAKFFVEDVCDRLRSHARTRPTYIEHAETVERELQLTAVCRELENLGVRDTFPFEERTFLKRAIQGIVTEHFDLARQMLARQTKSVWLGKGESQSQWGIVGASLNLMEACDDLEAQLSTRSRTLDDLLDFYTISLREADRLQRELEQAVGVYIDEDGVLDEVVARARKRYGVLAQKVQAVFIRQIEANGWPSTARLANADVYDRFVGERLKDRGSKVAFFMVDALRYELAIELQKLIADDGLVTTHAACAQLPTITTVGMASLLPGARNALYLVNQEDSIVPKLGDVTVSNVNQRLEVLRKQLGDRFAEMTLKDFVASKKPRVPSTVDLFLLRSTEIDSHLENSPEDTLELILRALKLIRVAIGKLRDLGFQTAIIATDHGFFLNTHAEPGDVCKKPEGRWVNAHDRFFLGDGVADAHNFVLPAQKLGVKGSFAQCAGPKSMAPYRAGHLYFHGGISLPEAVVPVLVVKLSARSKPGKPQYKVELSYRGGSKKITTRLPVIDVIAFSEDLFAQAGDLEILLEAQDERGEVVGEPRPGGDVNPATHTLILTHGVRKQIALQMETDFEGKFKIVALNPATLTVYNSLTLETDYAV